MSRTFGALVAVDIHGVQRARVAPEIQPSSTQLTLDDVPDNLDGAATHVQDLVNPLANLTRKTKNGMGKKSPGYSVILTPPEAEDPQ